MNACATWPVVDRWATGFMQCPVFCRYRGHSWHGLFCCHRAYSFVPAAQQAAMKFRDTFLALLALLLRCWRGLRAEQVLAISKPRLLSAVKRLEALPPAGQVDLYRARFCCVLLEVPE